MKSFQSDRLAVETPLDIEPAVVSGKALFMSNLLVNMKQTEREGRRRDARRR
jgi:hypothetical protein